METYCNNILAILNNETQCERFFRKIVDFIVLQDEIIDIEDRKCFEKKETTEYLISKLDNLKTYIRNDDI